VHFVSLYCIIRFTKSRRVPRISWRWLRTMLSCGIFCCL